MAKHFKRTGTKILGVDKQRIIHSFFGGNALVSILVLGAICFFLLREAILFFPQHHQDLEKYRKTGQEYVGFIIDEMDRYTGVVSLTNQAYFQEFNKKFGEGRSLVNAFGSITREVEKAHSKLLDEWYQANKDLAKATGAEADALKQKVAVYEAQWVDLLTQYPESADRAELDNYGRISDEKWQALMAALIEWRPLDKIKPALVTQTDQEMKEGMASFEVAKSKISSAGASLRKLRGELTAKTSEVRDELTKDKTASERKAALLAGAKKAATEEDRKRLEERAAAIVIRDSFPYAERIQVLDGAQAKHEAAVQELKAGVAEGVAMLPSKLSSQESQDLIKMVRKKETPLFKYLDKKVKEGAEWRWDKPYSFLRSLAAFFLGKDWVTNSSWHDFFGLLPLLTGSLLISIVALTVAIPFSLGSAIYVNRLAGPAQQNFIKPVIELIEAIPSVVLGFFGIMVLGEGLQNLSQVEWLSWVPGFPMQERLNILNAGLLLALMAVPTMFTLCEDALNNVPRAFTEASLALGASKLQTVIKIVTPAALSGILAAILLGFGRVIGETMVVLLVAGNKIAIPDFASGLGVITQPAHTMTGIIAQEMGEVTEGTLHYRALFSVGLVLFTISLVINVLAREIIKRFHYRV